MRRILLMLSIAVWAVPAAASAQFGVAANAGYFFPNGDQLYEDLEASPGFDGQIFYGFGPWQLGAGVNWIGFDFDEEAVGEEADDLTHLSIYAEPRMNFTSIPGISPFLAARVGWARENTDVTELGQTFEFEQSGWTVGVLAGLVYRLAGVAVEISGIASNNSFGDAEVDGEEEPDSDRSEQIYGVRLGVSFAFPR